MAFPTASVIDTFNRANGAPGSDWSADQTDNGFVVGAISSNQLATSGATGIAQYWDTSTFGADSEVYATVASFGGSQYLWLDIRIQNPDSASADCYRYHFGVNDRSLRRIDNKVETQLGAGLALPSYTNGDKVGIEAVGTTLTVYHNTGGSWSSVGSRTDSTYNAAGYIGLGKYDGSAIFDDFGGGTISGGGGTPAALVTRKALLGVGV